MLDLEVSPEEGLQHDHWEFILGMHFSQAVVIVQSQVRVIKSAHVIYNDQNPLSHDLILDLPGDGFRLIFDSNSQRLKLIEIYNMKLIRLKYCGTVFNGAEVIPTVHQIDRSFGATRPGTFDPQSNVFALNFRGLSFYFPVDSQFQPHYSHGLGSLRFPGEATPILSRIVIYHGSNGVPAEAPVPPLPPSCFRGNVFCESCWVLRNDEGTRTLGLRLKLFAQTTDLLEFDGEPFHFERTLSFGESAQSVVAKLGTPSKVYYKSDDKMKIHSKEAHKKVTSDKSDFFFNYFTLGIDILFDASSNLVVKFILHTNFPGHYDFTDYHRAPFALTLGRSSATKFLENLNPNPASRNSNTGVVEELLEKVSLSSHRITAPPPVIGGLPPALPPPPQPPSNGGGGGGKGKKKKAGKGKVVSNFHHPSSSSSSGSEKSSPPSGGEVTSLPLLIPPNNNPPSLSQQQPPQILPTHRLEIGWSTRWDEVRNFLWAEKGERGKLEKPVVLTRSSASNPFGPSLCYGVQDIIFEVMSNDHLATISLYNYPWGKEEEDPMRTLGPA